MNKRRALMLAAVLFVELALATGALAQGMPHIAWWIVAGGGGEASGAGEVAVSSTLGQPIIGPAGGDPVSLGAGYWYGALVQHRIYLPLVLREA